MALKKIIDVSFWNDSKVIEIFSPEDKLFMLYILTNPHSKLLGIYKISKKVMSFELGYSIDTINVLLERFEKDYNIIKYSKETDEIAIKNYLKYGIVRGGKPIEDCLIKDLKDVKNKELIKYVFDNIRKYKDINETVIKVINEYVNEYVYVYEVSYPDTCTDTYDDTSKRFKKPTINEIQNYCNERNNHVDAERFYNFYESKGWMVGKNKMKDWKAAVRTWEQGNKVNDDKLPHWFNDEPKRKEISDERKKLAEQLTNGTWKP